LKQLPITHTKRILNQFFKAAFTPPGTSLRLW
jgi:hypothetical protein